MILQIGALASTFVFWKATARDLFIYIFAVIVPLSQQLRNIIVLLSSFHSISVNRINHPFQLSLPLDSKPVGSAPHRFSRTAPLKPLAAAAVALAIATNTAITHSVEMPRQHVEACSEWRERHEHAALQTAVSAQRGQPSHACRLASLGFGMSAFDLGIGRFPFGVPFLP